MHIQLRFAATLLLLAMASASYAITPDEAALAVKANYHITTPGFFGNFKEIGNILTPRRSGLWANRPSNVFRPNVVKDHQVAVVGGGDQPLGNVHDGALKPGEKLYLYSVSVDNDYVQLNLFTVATYVVTGIRGPTPLQASVRFQYDSGLAKITTQQLLADIGEWLNIETDSRHTPANPCVPGVRTQTIRTGQTQEDVATILGPPEKQILLGTKAIFIYRDVKVVFVDGKVVDAE